MKPKWYTESFEKMTSPSEKFQYLAGLSELSWDDCCDAFYEAVKLIPEVAKERDALRAALESIVKEYTSGPPYSEFDWYAWKQRAEQALAPQPPSREEG